MSSIPSAVFSKLILRQSTTQVQFIPKSLLLASLISSSHYVTSKSAKPCRAQDSASVQTLAPIGPRPYR
jgi:hypothetical protein